MRVVKSKVLFFAMSIFFVLPPLYSEEFKHRYFNYLYSYPHERDSLGWNQEAQGIAHDDNYWYITDNGYVITHGDEHLWKIPVEHDLTQNAHNHPNTCVATLKDIPELYPEWDHFGDVDHYKYVARDSQVHHYVIVALAHDDAGGFAIFKSTENPSAVWYVADMSLPSGHAPWCAVHPQTGILYISGTLIGSIHKYSIDWEELTNTRRLVVAGQGSFGLQDGAGVPLTLRHMQGGEFTPTGDILYLTNGYGDHIADDGLHAFNTTTWRRIKHSSYSNRPFKFSWEPGEGEEPEGLTIWDLDNGRAPGIRGQLHVMLLDNDLGEDDVYIKHYSDKIYVDNYVIVPCALGEGIPLRTIVQPGPFCTVGEAVARAWTQGGAQINVKASSYPESVVINKHVKLYSTGGVAAIGLGGAKR